MPRSRLRALWWRAGLVLAALLPLAAAGCGPPKFYPVKGRVLFSDNLRPLTEGEVRFQSVSKPDLIATGRIQPDGSFALSTPGHGDGVLEGPCRVAISAEPRGGRPVVHERFAGFDTSDTRVTVTEREENYFILEVSRPGR